jgi:RNA polymerase sigma-70 factor (ECF subfamily)
MRNAASDRPPSWSAADLVVHVPALRAAGANLFRGSDELDDLIQETLERALRALQQGHPSPTHVAGYLVQILRNAFRDRLRRERRRPTVPYEDDVAKELDEPAPDWSHVSTEELQEALDRIDPKFAATLELHYIVGLRARQIAARLDIPENTVFTRLKRGRDQLRKLLGREQR